jgi:Tol biopolymer transport system component
VDGAYQPLEPLGDSVNSPYNEGDAVVAPDESFIVLTGYGRPDSRGGGDLYITYNRGGVWSQPRNLGPLVNTTAREFCPSLSPDGKYLYFTSEIGFAAEPRTRPLTMREFRDRLHSVRNGLGNVYRIERAVLDSAAPRATAGP